MKISFVTITIGLKAECLVKQWMSILSCRKVVDDYEVIIVGRMSDELQKTATEIIGNKYRFIPFTLRDNEGWVTRKYNIGCSLARFETIIIMNDDSWFGYDFFERLVTIPPDSYDYLACSHHREASGLRCWDWVYMEPEGHQGSCYELMSKYNYVSGNAVILKKSLWEQEKWNDMLVGVHADGDVEHSRRVIEKGYKVRADGKLIIITWEGEDTCGEPQKHAENCSCDYYKNEWVKKKC